MPYIIKRYNEDWAYDLNKSLFKGKELFNEDVISQSLDSIIGTIAGERLFNRSFGTGLFLYLFENLDNSTAEKILDEIIRAIKRWENRIIIDENSVRMDIYQDQNSIVLSIPYKIVRTGRREVYKKKITQ
jgi:phage baseplate assembly protein W